MRFRKYQGLGNDFIVTEGRASEVDPRRVAILCDRRFGVGADGVLVVEPGEAHPRMTVFNADGSRPEMCGNGVRCVARYLADIGSSPSVIETDAGPRRVRTDADEVAVEMGAARDEGELTVDVGARSFSGRRIDLGNPHFVLFGDWSDDEPGRFGPELEHHARFPAGVNVSFARTTGSNRVALRVWERGCGLTLACGTGACATAAAAWWSGRASADSIVIELPGGPLRIEGGPDALVMRGPAIEVFRGEVPGGLAPGG